MVNVDQKTEYQKFLENDLDKYIKEYQEIKIFKLVASEQIKNLFFRSNECVSLDLKGFAIDADGIILKDEKSIAKTFVVDVTFKELLNYQRTINATALNEEVISDDGIDKILYYRKQKTEEAYNSYENENLMKLKTINDVEMKINSDTYVLIPLEKIKNKAIKVDDTISEIEKYKYEYLSNILDEYYRNTFESKIERIKHSFAGKIKFRIAYDEDYIANYINASVVIGQDSISKCGVLILMISNSYVPASYLLENMLQCNIEIYDEDVKDDDKWKHFNDFIKNKYGVEKRGIPNVLQIVFSEKDDIPEAILTSWLMGEAYSKKGHGLGEIKLGENKNVEDYKLDVPTYENAVAVYASRDVVVEYNKRERLIFGRLENVISTLSAIELILFEEAAISTCEHKYQKIIDNKKLGTLSLVSQMKNIQEEFIRTIDFWNPNMRYMGSEIVEEEFRKKFEIDKHKNKLIEKQEKFNTYFMLRRDKRNAMESIFLSIVGCVLTASSIYDITSNGFTLKTLVLLIVIVLYVIYRFIFTRLV